MDLANALFELFGAAAIWFSIARVLRDREVAGVSWVTTAFFFSWGAWNLWFYPAVGCPASFWAGVAVVGTNLVYLSLLVRYEREKKR
jgi:hypothetical protein